MKAVVCAILTVYLLAQEVPAGQAAAVPTSAAVQAPAPDKENPGVKANAFRSGRGSFRSPRMGYTGGTRTRRPGPTNPVNRNPAAPATRTGGFLGGLFGGFFAGSLLGSLFHPFGYGGVGGVSLLGLIFWAVLFYLAYRLLRRAFGRDR